jgi:hypothetical protein
VDGRSLYDWRTIKVQVGLQKAGKQQAVPAALHMHNPLATCACCSLPLMTGQQRCS